MFPCRTDNAVGRLEPRLLNGKAASLVPGKLEENAVLSNLGSLTERQLEVGYWN